MSKRQVRFTDDAEDNLGEPQPHRFKEEHLVDSDDDDNSNDRKATPSDNVLTEDDIEGFLLY